MKKTIAIVFLASAFMMACSTTKSVSGVELVTVDGEDEIQIRGGEVSIKLYSKDKADTVESSIEYVFYEKPIHPYQDTINRVIKTYVSGVVSAGGGATEQNSELSTAYFEEAMDKYRDEYNRQLEFVDGGGVWQTETSIGIYHENPEFVEVSLGNWNYEGGAHGNAWSEQRIFEIPSGKELMLSDFFDDIGDLSLIAADIFRADQEIPDDQSLEDAGFWFEDNVFVLNENFVFNENSVDFLYNQYEIAPYAAGAIYLSIPMEKVKHLLKRKVKF